MYQTLNPKPYIYIYIYTPSICLDPTVHPTLPELHQCAPHVLIEVLQHFDGRSHRLLALAIATSEAGAIGLARTFPFTLKGPQRHTLFCKGMRNGMTRQETIQLVASVNSSVSVPHSLLSTSKNFPR